MRLGLGITLLVLSYVLGWPALAAVEAVAYALDSDWLAIYGGPGVYLFSWLLLGVAIYIGGPEAAQRLKEWIKQ